MEAYGKPHLQERPGYEFLAEEMLRAPHLLPLTDRYNGQAISLLTGPSLSEFPYAK